MPPDLELVVSRWTDLPLAVRAGILAMIRATTPGEPDPVGEDFGRQS